MVDFAANVLAVEFWLSSHEMVHVLHFVFDIYIVTTTCRQVETNHQRFNFSPLKYGGSLLLQHQRFSL